MYYVSTNGQEYTMRKVVTDETFTSNDWRAFQQELKRRLDNEAEISRSNTPPPERRKGAT